MGDALTSLAELINSAKDGMAKNIRTWIPAKVTKWDASTQRANCQPLVKEVDEDESGERTVNSLPVITGVPVQFMGAGGFRLTFPIEEGTLGSLFFSHRSLDRWLSGTGGEVDPVLDHFHSLSDTVFIPGLMPFGAPWSSCPTDEASIGDDADGNGRIHFPGGEVLLGDGASKEVARKTDGIKIASPGLMATWMSQVETALNGIAAGSVTPLSSTFLGAPGMEIKDGSAHVKAVD